MRPETRYAKSGDVSIAYQVLGDAPIDLILVPGFVSHVELAWEEPRLAHFMTRLASFSRLIALRMGLHHGCLCLRCCWAVMILLFVLGVMNLFWVALLATFVAVEKVASRGETVALIGGLVMIVWGLGALLGRV